MAITRVWQAGAEFQDLAELTYSEATISSTKARTGTYSFRVAQGFDGPYKDIDALVEGRYGFAINHNGPTHLTDTAAVVAIANAGGPVYVVEHVYNTGALVLMKGPTHASGTPLGTVTSATFNQTDTWLECSVQWKIGASGYFVFRVNGEAIFSRSEDNTWLSSTGVSRVWNGRYDAWYSNNYWANYAYLDDMYIDNTAGEGSAGVPSGIYLELLRPNGAGAAADFTPNTGTVNYENVDESPPDGDTTYNQSDAADEYDIYDLTSFVLPVGRTINAVIPVAYAKRLDAGGTIGLTPVVYHASYGTAEGTAELPNSGDYAYLKGDRFTTRPGGGAWGSADIAGLQAGYKSEGV